MSASKAGSILGAVNTVQYRLDKNKEYTFIVEYEAECSGEQICVASERIYAEQPQFVVEKRFLGMSRAGNTSF